MNICTRSLATVKPHMRGKAFAVIREHFRRNRQDFRKGWNYVFTSGRRRPQVRELPIVPPFEIKCDGDGALCEGEGVHVVGDLHLCAYCRALDLDGYGSRYHTWEDRPMSSTPLDLI